MKNDSGRRIYHRHKGQRTALGETEKRRLLQLGVCLLLFLTVFLAKGMGNTETMLGCGYNVYYAFLVKCPRFVQIFEKPLFTPMFIHEGDAPV